MVKVVAIDLTALPAVPRGAHPGAWMRRMKQKNSLQKIYET